MTRKKRRRKSRTKSRAKRHVYVAIILIASIIAAYFYGAGFIINDADTITGRVVRVADGDSFTLLTAENRQIRVRMHGIDAPESRQAFGEKSRQYLADMIAGQAVTLHVRDTDRFGRKVARVSTATVPDVGLAMLKAGFAWHYSRFDNTLAYIVAEREARERRIGLWADNNPVNPAEFRRRNR